MKTAMRKYEFTEETKTLCDGTVLHRICALIDIDLGWKIVKAGELGGWVEKEGNLSHIGKCWVYENAKVYGDAEVYGDARIYGDAEVRGDTRICGDAEVFGNANVYGNAKVWGNAKVYGDAKVCGYAEVCGYVKVYGDTKISGGAIVCVINHIADDACGSWYMKRFTEIK